MKWKVIFSLCGMVALIGCQASSIERKNTPPPITKSILISIQCANASLADVVDKLNESITEGGWAYKLRLGGAESWKGMRYELTDDVDPFSVNNDEKIWALRPLSLPKVTLEFDNAPIHVVLDAIAADLNSVRVAYFSSEAIILMLPPKGTENEVSP